MIPSGRRVRRLRRVIGSPGGHHGWTDVLVSRLQLRFTVGVITLSTKRAVLALVEEFTHDCLVLAGVGRRDPATSLLIDLLAGLE